MNTPSVPYQSLDRQWLLDMNSKPYYWWAQWGPVPQAVAQNSPCQLRANASLHLDSNMQGFMWSADCGPAPAVAPVGGRIDGSGPYPTISPDPAWWPNAVPPPFVPGPSVAPGPAPDFNSPLANQGTQRISSFFPANFVPHPQPQAVVPPTFQPSPVAQPGQTPGQVIPGLAQNPNAGTFNPVANPGFDPNAPGGIQQGGGGGAAAGPGGGVPAGGGAPGPGNTASVNDVESNLLVDILVAALVTAPAWGTWLLRKTRYVRGR